MVRIFFLPRRARVLASLAALAALVSVAAFAQLGGSAGILLPYTGHLEKDGVALDSLGVPVQFRFTLWDAPTGGTPCSTQYTHGAVVSDGAFAVQIGPVAELCVVGREIYLSVEVNDGEDFTALVGRQRVVPALAASTSGAGDFFVSGELGVDGALDVSGDLAVGGALAVDGALGVAGPMHTVGSLTVGTAASMERLALRSTEDASPTSTTHGLTIGSPLGTNLALDGNEILARHDGLAAALYLNNDGGNVVLGASSSVITVRGEMAGFVRGGGQSICNPTSSTERECRSWGTGSCQGGCNARVCNKGTGVSLGSPVRCYTEGNSWDNACWSWVCVE